MLYSIRFHHLAVHLRSIFQAYIPYPRLLDRNVTALYDYIIRASKRKHPAKSAARRVAIPRLDVYGNSSQSQRQFSRPPMLIRGPCRLHHSHFTARALRTSCPDTLRKSIHSSIVPPNEKDGTDQNKVYAKSLLLPRTTFPQWTDPLKTEAILRKKTCDDLYRWQVRFKWSTFPSIDTYSSHWPMK